MSRKNKDYSSYEFEGQHPDESVQMVFRQHPIVMRRALIYGLLALVVFSLPLSFWPLANWPWWSLLAGFIVMLLIFGYRYMSWHFSVYIVTNERLVQIKQNGFFDRKVVDISHSKIQSVNYEVKGLQATLFHFGTIIVQTYVGDLTLRFVHKPAQIHQVLVKDVRHAKPSNRPDMQNMEAEKEEDNAENPEEAG
jgi:uncharacterized membrane protein YdbT with pleckstrin-like domain